jgi:hypothetical protein
LPAKHFVVCLPKLQPLSQYQLADSCGQGEAGTARVAGDAAGRLHHHPCKHLQLLLLPLRRLLLLAS